MLGVPLGHTDFVDRFLQRKIDVHKVLLERIPVVPDVQVAWLILLYHATENDYDYYSKEIRKTFQS